LSYYDYGVVSLELEIPFTFDWSQLVLLAARWVASGDVERLAQAAVRDATSSCRAHFVKPYDEWLSEDYCIVHVLQQPGSTAADLISQRANETHHIARRQRRLHRGAGRGAAGAHPIIRTPAGRRLSAAFLYDSADGARPPLGCQVRQHQLLTSATTTTFSRILASV
jgi:hypothetical protein